MRSLDAWIPPRSALALVVGGGILASIPLWGLFSNGSARASRSWTETERADAATDEDSAESRRLSPRSARSPGFSAVTWEWGPPAALRESSSELAAPLSRAPAAGGLTASGVCETSADREREEQWSFVRKACGAERTTSGLAVPDHLQSEHEVGERAVDRNRGGILRDPSTPATVPLVEPAPPMDLEDDPWRARPEQRWRDGPFLGP